MLKNFESFVNENEGYIESMNPHLIDEAIDMIKTAWKQWKEGPLTDKSDIKPAQKELLDYISSTLKKEIK